MSERSELSYSLDEELDLPPIRDEDFLEFKKRAYRLSSRHPEEHASRELVVAAILEVLFKDDFKNRKIIDVGAGFGKEGEIFADPPHLAKFLGKIGAEVLAIDSKIEEEDSDGTFTTAQIELGNFDSKDIPVKWQDSDVVVSVSFLGVPTDQSEIDARQLIKELSKVAKFQIHAVLLGENKRFGKSLTTENLQDDGFQVIYNSLQTGSKPDDLYNYLILKRREQE